MATLRNEVASTPRSANSGSVGGHEGMSVEALFAGIGWTFETFPEYLDAVERAGRSSGPGGRGQAVARRLGQGVRGQRRRRLPAGLLRDDRPLLGLPSVHTGAWNSLWAACEDTAATIASKAGVSEAGLSEAETWRLLRGNAICCCRLDRHGITA